MTFHAYYRFRRHFAWNVKAYFQAKLKKKKQQQQKKIYIKMSPAEILSSTQSINYVIGFTHPVIKETKMLLLRMRRSINQ